MDLEASTAEEGKISESANSVEAPSVSFPKSSNHHAFRFYYSGKINFFKRSAVQKRKSNFYDFPLSIKLSKRNTNLYKFENAKASIEVNKQYGFFVFSQGVTENSTTIGVQYPPRIEAAVTISAPGVQIKNTSKQSTIGGLWVDQFTDMQLS